MATSIIQKISTRAKSIRRAHPSKKWQDCIKQASRELKGSSVSGSKPAKKKKKPAARKSKPRPFLSPSKKVRRHRPAKSVGSVDQAVRGIPTKIAVQVSEKLRCLERVHTLRHKIRDRSMTASEKASIRRTIEYYMRCARAHKANIANLKKLI